MADLAFQCSCGALEGVVIGATPKSGTHAECFCASCRAGELYSNAADPAPGPVGIFQTSPHRLKITKGAENLSVFSFGPKNLLRWRASCCKSPLFNTTRNPKISFVGIRTNRFADTAAIGPVVAQGFIPAAGDKVTHNGLTKMLLGAARRIVGNRITGRWKDNPLFDTQAATPIAAVTVVSKADREALLA